MNRNILYYLEQSASEFSEKCAVKDETKKFTYKELYTYSRKIGTALSGIIEKGEPVGVFMEKSADASCAFFGIVYAGGFYSVLNNELPPGRLKQIESVLAPKAIITNKELQDTASEIFPKRNILRIEDRTETPENEFILGKIRENMIDTDPLYINFTSGSTGTPKGIVVSHRSVIDFTDCFTEVFSITNSDII